MLKMDLEYIKEILFIRLDGKLTKKTNHKLYNYIIPALVKHKIKYVVYNLKDLKEIDEIGIDTILNSKCKVKRNGGKVYLCEVNNEILFKIKRLRLKCFSSEFIALRQIEVMN